MGLLRTGIGTVTGVLSDQWKEYFYCDALGADVLLPAHGCVALSRGNAHLKRAVERLDTLALPRNAIGE